MQHIGTWKNIIDLGGVQGGPKYAGDLGGILGESGGGHQAERLSWLSVQGDPRYNPGGGSHCQYYSIWQSLV